MTIIASLDRREQAAAAQLAACKLHRMGTTGTSMSDYRAVFRRTIDRSGQLETCFEQQLVATNIQTAIDEALALVAEDMIVTSIDIHVGDDKVETVGVGADSART